MNFAGGFESPDSLANSTTNNSGFDLSVWIVPIMAIVIFIVAIVTYIIITKLEGIHKGSDTGNSSGKAPDNGGYNRERKKMRCPRCGSRDIHYVDFVVQDGKQCTLLNMILIISVAVSIIAFIFVIETSNRPGVDWEEFIVLPAVLIFKYSFTLTLMLTLFKSIVPYRTRNEIHYICSDCGKTGTLKKLREEASLLPYNEDEQGKNTEQITDTPENTTQDTEHLT